MSITGILIVLGVAIVPPALMLWVGFRATGSGFRISGILLFLLLAAFILASVRPRLVEKLQGRQSFTVPGDYQDHVEFGWPAGFWRSFPDPQWDTLQNQLDIRGLALDVILWGYFAWVAALPVVIQRVRNKRTRMTANTASMVDLPARHHDAGSWACMKRWGIIVLSAAIAGGIAVLSSAMYLHGIWSVPRPSRDTQFVFHQGGGDFCLGAVSTDRRWAIFVSIDIFNCGLHEGAVTIDLAKRHQDVVVELWEASSSFKPLDEFYTDCGGPRIAHRWKVERGSLTVRAPGLPPGPRPDSDYEAEIMLNNLIFRLDGRLWPVRVKIDPVRIQAKHLGWMA